MNCEIETLKKLLSVVEEVKNLDIFQSKYILYPKEHINRCKSVIDTIHLENKKILDIGCGNGYLLYLCRELYGCEVTGLEIFSDISDRQEMYAALTKRLNIDVIKHTITPLEAMPIIDKYDIITATATMFNKEWTVNQHKFWVDDCRKHLRENGKIAMLVNKSTLTPESESFFKPYLFPHRSGRLYIIPAHLDLIQKDH